jgi:RIO-like serine/threonine protein kinase
MNLDRIIAVRNNKTVYRDGDKCLKVFNEDYSKADVLNEALNQARIEETGLKIPKILEVTVIDGKWTIVSEYIEGTTLAQLMAENPEKKDEYLNFFVDLQLSMHEKTCPMLNKLKDKMNRKISQTDLSATVRYDLHMRLESMPKHNKVCHGDFNPSNIIITADGTPYIIDWAHATQGNASADAARTYLLFWLNGDIDGAKSYLKLFCDKSNVAMQYVQKWMPIVAASQSVKGNEKEREFLRSWIDVVDYE